jgi:hypothetical protein
MPFLVEPLAALPPDGAVLVVPADELEVCVAAGADDVVEVPDEFEPQAASATATSAASATAARRRADDLVGEFITAP